MGNVKTRGRRGNLLRVNVTIKKAAIVRHTHETTKRKDSGANIQGIRGKKKLNDCKKSRTGLV